MPTHLTARPPLDAFEERQGRKLARSAHAPAAWIFHAKLIVRSWDGLRTRQIALERGCHPQTVREQLHAFNDRGLDGLGMQPGSGRRPRLTQRERSTILGVVKLPPPGKPTYELTGELAAPDPAGEPEWTLDTLTAAAQQRGIQVARSQVRRIFRQEGVRWRRTRLWATTRARIPILPQKGADRRALHRAAAGRDGPLCRRTRPRNAQELPARSWLVARWPPDQSAPRLRAGTRQGVDLRGAVRARRTGADADSSGAQHDHLSRVA